MLRGGRTRWQNNVRVFSRPCSSSSTIVRSIAAGYIIACSLNLVLFFPTFYGCALPYIAGKDVRREEKSLGIVGEQAKLGGMSCVGR